jgi:hypothetical protein
MAHAHDRDTTAQAQPPSVIQHSCNSDPDPPFCMVVPGACQFVWAALERVI